MNPSLLCKSDSLIIIMTTFVKHGGWTEVMNKVHASRMHIDPYLPLCCSYMRHAFGLGEHYNSVEALKDSTNAEDNS